MPIKSHESSHQHNEETYFDQMLADAVEANTKNKDYSTATSNAPNRLKSDAQLYDDYSSEEDRKRSMSISSILRHYDESYSSKVEFQHNYRKFLFWGCGVVTLIFSLAIILLIGYSLLNIEKFDLAGVAAMITATVSLVVAILGIIKIITNYCFPEKDEEYIVKIVESIQNNYLETMKEHNRSTEARNNPQNVKDS